MPSPCRFAPLLICVLAGCVSLPPEGPSVTALPGSGQRFETFRADDAMCRSYAREAIGPQTPAQAAVDAGAASAAIGTLVGAALGAAINGSRGAAVGAGVGLLAGSTAGVGAANASSQALQQRYDQSYVQCMYARGHKVPVIGGVAVKDGSADGYQAAPTTGRPAATASARGIPATATTLSSLAPALASGPALRGRASRANGTGSPQGERPPVAAASGRRDGFWRKLRGQPAGKTRHAPLDTETAAKHRHHPSGRPAANPQADPRGQQGDDEMATESGSRQPRAGQRGATAAAH